MWLKQMATNPQTTVSGIASLAAGAMMVVNMINGKDLNPEQMTAAGGLIATGLGLIFASDAKKEDK